MSNKLDVIQEEFLFSSPIKKTKRGAAHRMQFFPPNFKNWRWGLQALITDQVDSPLIFI